MMMKETEDHSLMETNTGEVWVRGIWWATQNSDETQAATDV